MVIQYCKQYIVTIFCMQFNIYNFLYAILYDMSTLKICIVNNILYAILYDMLNIASDS